MNVYKINSAHSSLLQTYVKELTVASKHGPILDLACGSGRNGLYLARLGLPVIFADQDAEKLQNIEHIIKEEKLTSTTWLVDLESGDAHLVDNQYGAIIVFRYLHRPLFNSLKRSVKPSGVVIYETFNEAQRKFGRPRNPNFLLQENELIDIFSDWHILHQFDGEVGEPISSISQVVVQRNDV
jgi:tellurite methyltransferase